MRLIISSRKMRIFLVVLYLFALINVAYSLRKVKPSRVKRLARHCVSKVRRFERDCTTKVTGLDNIDGCTKFNTTVLESLIGKKPITLPKRVWKEKKCLKFVKMVQR